MIVVRMVQIQVYRAEDLRELATRQQSSIVEIDPVRGTILSRVASDWDFAKWFFVTNLPLPDFYAGMPTPFAGMTLFFNRSASMLLIRSEPARPATNGTVRKRFRKPPRRVAASACLCS